MITRILLVLFLLLFSSHAWAGDVIKVGLMHFPPWSIIEGPEVSGADQELAAKIFDRMGLEPEYVHLTFNEILEGLKNGEIDIASGLLYRSHRDKFIQFISPPVRVRSPKAFYLLRSADFTIENYTDLLGMKIGVSKGAKYFPVFDVDHRVYKVASSSTIFSFNKLLKGEVDVVISTESGGDYYVSELGIEDKIRKAKFRYDPKSTPVYYGMSRKSRYIDRHEEFGALLRFVQGNGVQESVLKKYLGPEAGLYTP